MKCPCQSKISYDECCKPFHDFTSLPETAEKLMRSRFSAYAKNKIDYIIETTDPEGPVFRSDIEGWKESIAHFCQTTSFQNLTILDRQEIDDKKATVTFKATLMSITGEDISFTEKSLFTEKKGRWYYHSAVS